MAGETYSGYDEDDAVIHIPEVDGPLLFSEDLALRSWIVLDPEKPHSEPTQGLITKLAELVAQKPSSHRAAYFLTRLQPSKDLYDLSFRGGYIHEAAGNTGLADQAYAAGCMRIERELDH